MLPTCNRAVTCFEEISFLFWYYHYIMIIYEREEEIASLRGLPPKVSIRNENLKRLRGNPPKSRTPCWLRFTRYQKPSAHLLTLLTNSRCSRTHAAHELTLPKLLAQLNLTITSPAYKRGLNAHVYAK